jgi:hypothetical protein
MSWLAELDAVSAGFFEQAASVNIRKIDNKYNARERMIYPSGSKFVEAKTLIEAGEVAQIQRDDSTFGRGLYTRYACSMLSVR